MNEVLQVLAVIIGGFVVLPVVMFLAAHLFIFWLAGMNWCAKKFDDFLCKLFWGE
jgi:hypothetical protein